MIRSSQYFLLMSIFCGHRLGLNSSISLSGALVGNSSWTMTQKRRLHRIILDTDPGTDDAAAIGMILSHPMSFQVEAVTTVFGNDILDTSTHNVCRILEMLGKTKIPVYKGASKALDLDEPSSSDAKDYHGSDGLNDRPDLIPSVVNKKYECGMSAAEVICKLASDNPGEISIVAIGPLTNLAEALSLCPNLPKIIRDLYIMGTSTTVGNMTPFAEFNTFMDPLATEITLREFSGYVPVRITPWDSCLKNYITFPQLDKLVSEGNSSSPYHRLFEAVKMTAWLRKQRIEGGGYIMADQFIPVMMAFPGSGVKVERYGEVRVNTERGSERFGEVRYEERGEGGGLEVWMELEMSYMEKMLREMLK